MWDREVSLSRADTLKCLTGEITINSKTGIKLKKNLLFFLLTCFQGLGDTPFGPVSIPPPEADNNEMLALSLSDFVLNSLFYHAYKWASYNVFDSGYRLSLNLHFCQL